MPVFDARQIATEQTGTLFDVALGHAFLQSVVANGLTDIHGREHFRMGNGNQIGNFWQGEICAMRRTIVPWKTHGMHAVFLRVRGVSCTPLK